MASEDHTDKSLLERADAVVETILSWGDPYGTMKDAAQVISDLKTALERANVVLFRVEAERDAAQATIASLREEIRSAGSVIDAARRYAAEDVWHADEHLVKPRRELRRAIASFDENYARRILDEKEPNR